MKEFKKEILNNKNQEVYILNKAWLKKWKNYINYNEIKLAFRYNLKRNDKVETNEDENEKHPYPGCINNFQILLPMTEYFNDGDRDNNDNLVVNPEINVKQNLKIVNEKIWTYFYNKYGGGPAIKTRYVKKTNSDEEEVEIFKDKVSSEYN